MKKILCALIVLTMMLGMIPVFASSPAIGIVIDGVRVNSDVAPVVRNGTTLVPVRVVSEALGAMVSYDVRAKTVTIDTAAVHIVLTIGSRTALVNGVPMVMLKPVETIRNRTMIPLRFVSEAIGAQVRYANNTATINYFTTVSGTVKAGGSSTVAPIGQSAADELMKMSSVVSVSYASSGSGNGIKGAIDGSFNVGASSRELTDAEKAANPDLKVFPVAIDGIAIIVHKNNPIAGLTKDQIKSIFLGETTNWKDVGGANAPIFVQTRESVAGTLASFVELVLGKDASGKMLTVVSTATPFVTNGLVKEAVAGQVNAIGFVSMGYVDASVKAVTVNGIAATVANLKNATYPIRRTLDVMTKGMPIGATAVYIDFIRSTKVQAIAEKEGYLSIRE
jgi:phosphate transport system substrate-binding protein